MPSGPAAAAKVPADKKSQPVSRSFMATTSAMNAAVPQPRISATTLACSEMVRASGGLHQGPDPGQTEDPEPGVGPPDSG